MAKATITEVEGAWGTVSQIRQLPKPGVGINAILVKLKNHGASRGNFVRISSSFMPPFVDETMAFYCNRYGNPRSYREIACYRKAGSYFEVMRQLAENGPQ